MITVTRENPFMLEKGNFTFGSEIGSLNLDTLFGATFFIDISSEYDKCSVYDSLYSRAEWTYLKSVTFDKEDDVALSFDVYGDLTNCLVLSIKKNDVMYNSYHIPITERERYQFACYIRDIGAGFENACAKGEFPYFSSAEKKYVFELCKRFGDSMLNRDNSNASNGTFVFKEDNFNFESVQSYDNATLYIDTPTDVIRIDNGGIIKVFLNIPSMDNYYVKSLAERVAAAKGYKCDFDILPDTLLIEPFIRLDFNTLGNLTVDVISKYVKELGKNPFF